MQGTLVRRVPPLARLTAALLTAALVWLADGRGMAATTQEAGEFLVNFGKRAVEEINDEALSPAVRDKRFRELFNEAVDVRTIGKFVLGAHWRRATKQERADFLRVFEDIAVQRFLPMFTRDDHEYSGSGFEIVSIKRDESKGGHIFVTVVIFRDQQDPINLIWRMREREDRFKILDISAEGLSMALTLRQEYNSAIKKLGSVTKLVVLLREKLDAGAFAPKPVSVN